MKSKRGGQKSGGKSRLKEMYDLQLERNLSRISEERNAEVDMLQPWERKAEEMEVVKSLVDDGENVYFNYVEMPSETEPGSFRVLLRPNCGADLAGCFIEMNFNYTSVHSAIDIEYELLPDTAVGLDND